VVTNVERVEPASAKMPIMRHLRELRDRIFKSLIAVVITTALAFIFANQIFQILLLPAGNNIHLQAIELVENIAVYFKVCLVAGIIVAMPFLVYQFFAFVAPGLTKREKWYVFRIVPGITVMFLIGVAFAYFVALPPALGFLFNFMSNIAEPQIRISNYIDVVTRLILAVGLVFETPIIIMFLARMGLVSPQWLAKRRKIWIVFAFVIAAIITPTFDPINQTIVAVPLIVLLELSILLARVVYKKRTETA
jgi:sec-independent protein translocase protein TatC